MSRVYGSTVIVLTEQYSESSDPEVLNVSKKSSFRQIRLNANDVA